MDEESVPENARQHFQEVVPPKRFPVCIVWVPIPLITWLFPPIGHMGIGLSNGVILDFVGPQFVSIDQLGFGNPTRYIQLSPKDITAYDDALDRSATLYQMMSYNILTNNCHAFVAHCLNLQSYNGRQNWEMVSLAALIFFRGRFVSPAAAAKTWLPFLLLLGGGLLFGGARALLYWLYCVVPLVGWYLFYTFVVHSPRDLLLRTPVAKAGAKGQQAAADAIVAKLTQQEAEAIAAAQAACGRRRCCDHHH